MSSESARIADQLRRVFMGDAWHGPPIVDLLGGLSPAQAQARPVPSAHTIGELVLHMNFWLHAALEASRGVAMPKLDAGPKDWPAHQDNSAEAWFTAQDHLFRNVEALARVIEECSDAKLQHVVPGRDYDFYRLFHGIVQHSVHHGGQIAILKKAITGD